MITITRNSRVRFQSLSLSDPNVYVGTITDLLSYKTATKFLDVEGSTEIIKQSNSSLADMDYKTLEYFILAKESTSSSGVEDIVFAKEWIKESTYIVLDQLYTATIDVVGITSEEVQAAVEILKANGFVAQLISQKTA